MKPYSIPYHFNGRDYDLTIHAHDHDDAHARLRAAFYQRREPEEVVLRINAKAPRWLSRMIGGKYG